MNRSMISFDYDNARKREVDAVNNIERKLSDWYK